MPEAVEDLKDIRVLIPRMRRALDGPEATSSAVSGVMSDEQVGNAIADSIASVIFYTNGGWGRKLIVTERDSYYMAPIAWETDEPLGDDEATAVIAQAALDHFHFALSEMKTSETLRNEGEEWQWAISASALAERIRNLRALRDEAIAKLMSQGNVAEEWVNTLAIRDQYTDALIEPWLGGAGGGQEIDFRFGGVL
jgi:hypothetical protein